MQQFRTLLNMPYFPEKVQYPDRILCMGSCFAEHIAGKLMDLKFPTILNPFGILYNPVSVANGLERLLNGSGYRKEDLFFHQELWHSYDHHGHFSHTSEEVCLEQINEAVKKGGEWLKTARWCLITLGTAFVFVEKEQQRIVANCHKVPGNWFDRRKLSVGEVISALDPVIQDILAANEQMRFIFTVSPVRHIRDGLIENQRSKAVLLLAVEALIEKYAQAYYFPSYELMLDDLRDYRFYGADMIHANDQAVDYIWGQFSAAFFAEKDRHLMQDIGKVVQASRHRPLHPGTAAHRTFVKRQLKKMLALQERYGFLSFEEEKRRLKKGMAF